MIKTTGFLSILLLLMALAGCGTLPENVDRTPSKAFTDTGDTAISRAIARKTSDHPGQSGFLLIENGLDALVAREVLFAQIGNWLTYELIIGIGEVSSSGSNKI